MVRPPKRFVELARQYVCVRVTDMQHIDLNRYRFDFDLTLCVLLAHPDGTIYHRFGGRTREDPLAWMSMPALHRVMQRSLAEHAAHRAKTAAPRKRHTVYDIATFKQRMDRRPRRPDCIHCHTVHEAEVRDRQDRGVFTLDSVFVWPAPARVGLTMEAVEQDLIRSVAKGSAAAQAGLRAGDRLVRVGTQRVLTIHDLQWVLHRVPFQGGSVPVVYQRGGKSGETRLVLADGFKRVDPLTYSWRPYKWPLRPAPGFGGALLDAGQKRALGLAAEQWAFRVQYLVDWGDRPQQGRANRRAGLRKGDVVVRYAGKDDFRDMDHFHAWTRLTRKKGEKVEIEVLRRGQKKVIRVTLR